MKRITATRVSALAAAALLFTAASTNAAALFTILPSPALPVTLSEPASLVMLGAGLFGLAGAVRRLTAAGDAS